MGLDEKKEFKSSGGGLEEAKGKDGSSKMMRWENNRRFMVRSRRQYPLCSEEYRRKTH
jgi:hypothetical protein